MMNPSKTAFHYNLARVKVTVYFLSLFFIELAVVSVFPEMFGRIDFAEIIP